MAYFDRALSSVLAERVKQAKCVLVTGARQVGKSTMLTKTFPDYERVSFDDMMVLTAVRGDAQLFFKNLRLPVVLDEVQEAPEIFRNIKIACDSSDERGRFIMTGSQVFELMRLSGESLAGRISIMELLGLSMRELCLVDFNEPFLPTEDYISHRDGKIKPYEDVWQRIFLGGFPELSVANRDRNDFFSSYVRTYIQRDILSFTKIRDAIAFNKFLVAAAARTGQLLNFSSLAEDAGISVMTAKEWVGLLERSGIVFLLQPYHSNAIKRAIKTPKLYFFDTGLAAYLTRWSSSDVLASSYIAGNIFETFVISEIIKSYANAGKDYKFGLYFYRGRDKDRSGGEVEIDLLIEEDNIFYPIEIKKSATPRKEMASAFEVLKKETGKSVGLGAILCQCDRKIYLSDDLIALPLEYV